MAKKLPNAQADEVRPEEPTVAEPLPVPVEEPVPVEAPVAEPPVVLVTAEAPVGDLLLTPAEWAARKGHTNPTDPRVRGITNYKAWIFEAAKHHAGWGTRVALNKPMTSAEYDEAVESACNIALSGQ